MYNLFFKPLTGGAHVKRSVVAQRGSTLVELLVGVAVGLAVIGIAFSTLVVSRTVTVAVNDQLELQQQANMAMRIMSTALRQASSVELVPSGVPTIPGVSYSLSPNYDALGNIVGTSSLLGLVRDAQDNDSFGVAYGDAGPPNPTLDCLGNKNAAPVLGGVVNNRFYVNASRLMCEGTNAAAGPQPLISDVQRLRVLYGVLIGTGAAATMRYFTQANVPSWGAANGVVAVELCLELASAKRPMEPVGNYTDCDGVVIPNDQRVRVVVRQAVRLRSVPIS
ncbi:MAG: hypothetical protein A3I66_20410 [Burkholderiales bacterium RIFCSPLOWO2_02_FULL_57_36]|nr:MAG: hypothetical protein A3I66_20410 [Burkholderiales bacterium RIFCSPLOWO2_02_FULL_57_36]